MLIKECIIVNSKFSWLLKVDGRTIPFSTDPEYFAQIYQRLGYEVVWDMDEWERTETKP